jgi:alpha-D-ribose 1-methylphosphonate 5-triphosphate synthase subunit PhnL
MPASEPPVLRVESLGKRFRIHEVDAEIQGFHNISFEVRTNEIVVLVGASGSGKSSVLKCLYRTYLTSEGAAWYTDAFGTHHNLATASELEILRLRSEEIRLVSQFLRVLPRQTPIQIVANEITTLSPDDANSIAKSTLSKVGLPESLWHIPPNSFSGGERQLLNLARALVVRPRLLLLDEPTASLDARSTERVLAAIEQLKGPDLAMLAVFHDLQTVERLSDQTIAIGGGIQWDTVQ